jgi:superfamily II DNA or RNA helicase
MSEYADFIARKLAIQPPAGLLGPFALPASLFPFQYDVTRWACKRGRCAIFAGTGLGKTAMSLSWAQEVARHTQGNVLVLAPLAVARQTRGEGQRIGVDVTVCRESSDVRPGINVTNYDRLEKFAGMAWSGVVLGESSIIKHHDAKTFAALCEAFSNTAFKLCETATPAPNDHTELGQHAEFLGICTRQEMLSEFFCHDGGETQKWRLKRHAKAQFWRWVASWAAMLRKPSDLGYDDGDYNLPPLTVHEHIIAASIDTYRAAGLLIPMEARGLNEQRKARKGSIADRVKACADVVNAEPGEAWVVWCDLNDESAALTKAIAGAVEVTGSMSNDEKESALSDFAEGRARVLVSKPSICGWGLNWQHAARMAFVGVTHSWEAYYQAVRREWRFGQKREVIVHVFASEAEGGVVANLKRKEIDAQRLGEELARETADAVRAEIRGSVRTVNEYTPRVRLTVPAWLKSEDAA